MLYFSLLRARDRTYSTRQKYYVRNIPSYRVRVVSPLSLEDPEEHWRHSRGSLRLGAAAVEVDPLVVETLRVDPEDHGLFVPVRMPTTYSPSVLRSRREVDVLAVHRSQALPLDGRPVPCAVPW